MTKLHQMAAQGQAIWLDYIQRSLIDSGELERMVVQGVRGVTSNPTIFEKAIAGSEDYDEEMQALARAGKSAEEIYDALSMDDIRRATDVLRTVYDKTQGEDGYVSLEVNPNLADDTERTVSEARRLFDAVGRPNLMIKVPATPAGLPAVTRLIAAGVNVNVTLIFSLAHYEAVAEAYIRGLEERAGAGGDPGSVASVASLFVSRTDTTVDKLLDGKPDGAALRGKIAVANAKLAYARFKEIFRGERWERLAGSGARVQRPLWASTGTKDPAYPDTLYVDTLIGPHTVNTLPPSTLDAFIDHGQVALTVEEGLEVAREQVARLATLGIDLDAITQDLQEKGVASFAKSFEGLMASIREKRARLMGGERQPSAN